MSKEEEEMEGGLDEGAEEIGTHPDVALKEVVERTRRTLSDTSRSWPTHQNEETGRLMCSQVGWIPLSFEAGNVKLGQRAWALLVVTFWVISFDGRCDGRRAEFLLILHVLFFDY
ncbi:unnamed protein product [Durusdinium trenchii]|uniref:Uncharacterized protein n=1 Tax=Durusdinium trenchii TaxID=1381693 RepID=A0ABP0NTX7_9DINO